MKRRTIIIFILVSALALLFWVLQNNQIKSLGQASRAGTPAALKKTNDIISERYHVKRGSKRLYGVITAPRGYKREKLPLVIISHGFNNTLEMYENMLIILLVWGILFTGLTFMVEVQILKVAVLICSICRS